MLLEHKKVLVTGGSRGVGRAICGVFAREGADVAFCYASNHEAAEETTAIIQAHGRDALAVQADIGDRATAGALVERVTDAFGRIDVLVLNAGINRSSLLLRMPDEHWDEIMRVNVGGLYNVGKPVFQQMARQRSGCVLVVTSIAALRAIPAGVPYAVSKAAAIGFTKALAREGAPFGVRANALALGVIETDLADQIPDHFLDTYEGWSPMGRFGRPEEPAELAAFLASDRNSYMTGEVIVQDGGAMV